ncbi:MAG: alpha/beta hydrolase [Actinobacteria bacterium]|nr:MAG: alpha/beta hydrolase [Actinomycetota bacterium]
MDEQFCDVGGGIRLCYDTFGDPADPPLLLIMGLGTQMVAWHGDFCGKLVDEGFRVIRFDNRDIGRSTHLDGAPTPTLRQLLVRRPPAAYRLEDMAGDTAGLLYGLGISAAHIVGASMGGMIAQTLAATRPERVLSLTSIMSTTGNRRVGQPAWRVMPIFLKQAPRDRDAFIDHTELLFKAIGSSGIQRDDAELREVAGLMYDRGLDPGGTSRQLAAIIASGNRTPALRRITAPTVVIHGTADRLVRPSGGRATVRAIPGAKLVKVDGMGHDLPRAAWDQIVAAIVENARRAGFSRSRAAA